MKAWNDALAKGIDVSHWQGVIDWAKVKATGVSFVFLKASQGTKRVDPKFDANVKGARKQGILIGAYHYMNASTASAAVAEAEHFLKTTKPYELDLPLVLDIEDGPNTAEAGLAFVKALEKATGQKPLVYTFPSFIDSKLSKGQLAGYPLWYAYYNKDKSPRDRGGWTSWDFIQYSATGKVNGISGNVDMNVFKGTVAELQARYAPKTTSPAPTPVPTPVKPTSYPLAADTANIVIKMWLSPAWFNAKGTEDKDHLHWMANELRKAAGILPADKEWKLEASTATQIINGWLSPAWFNAKEDKAKQARIHGYANELRKAAGILN